MQKLARHPHASEHFAELMGHFGQATNALAFLFSLLGTRCGPVLCFEPWPLK